MESIYPSKILPPYKSMKNIYIKYEKYLFTSLLFYFKFTENYQNYEKWKNINLDIIIFNNNNQ